MIFLVFVSQITLSWDAPVSSGTCPDDIALHTHGLTALRCSFFGLRDDVTSLLESFHSAPDSESVNQVVATHWLSFWFIFSFFRDSKTVSDSNSAVAFIWLHILFPVFALVILMISSNHVYPSMFESFMFFKNLSYDFSWLLSQLLLFHHVTKWWFCRVENKASMTACTAA